MSSVDYVSAINTKGSGLNITQIVESLVEAETKPKKDLVDKKIVDNKTYYFAKTSNQTKQIPSFLIEKNNKESNLDNLLKGLKLVGDYMEKSILKPNNLNYPISRREFITNLK